MYELNSQPSVQCKALELATQISTEMNGVSPKVSLWRPIYEECSWKKYIMHVLGVGGGGGGYKVIFLMAKSMFFPNIKEKIPNSRNRKKADFFSWYCHFIPS